jgi:hypothetical protein
MATTGIEKEHVAGEGDWEQGVAKGIAASGHKGIFKAAAQRAGKSTQEFADEHKHDSGTLGKRARLALAFMDSKH